MLHIKTLHARQAEMKARMSSKLQEGATMTTIAMSPHAFRNLREDLELTQEQLAEKLGVHRVTVARWEIGLLDIDIRTAMAIEHLACRESICRVCGEEREDAAAELRAAAN